MTLSDFLMARYAEAEASARYAAARDTGPTWHAEDCEQCGGHVLGPSTPARELVVVDCQPNEGGGLVDPVHRFIAEHDPAHVLADLEAKRRIVASFEQSERHAGTGEFGYHTVGLRLAVRCLASAYSDHPDYDADWSPE